MKRLRLTDLHRLRNKEKRKSNERFRIDPGGDIYLILIYYSKERMSARNTRTNKVEEFNSDLFVIPEGE